MSFCQTVQHNKSQLRALFPETPLQYSDYLSEKYEAKIYLKREDLTPVRSYKIRGAFSFISQMTDTETKRGVVCASAGNHAQGFAFACAHFKIKGDVFMPTTTPQQKITKTKVFGGEFIKIHLVGDTFDEANKAAITYCEKQQSALVPPFDHPRIIEGQATVGAEILDHFTPDIIVLPVGGGGVSAGISTFFAQEAPDTTVYCVEPIGADGLAQSLKAGKIVELKKVDTFVDGAAVCKIGTYTFEKLKQNIKKPVILCPENRICQTMLDFLNREGIVMEPAGALSVDGLKDIANDIKGKTVVCVVSGGNFDFERLPDVKERAMKFSETKKYFILGLPQRPGALREFLDLLGPNDDIARFEYLKKSSKNFGSVLLGIETSDPKNFKTLFAKMQSAGFGFEDVTDNAILADFVL